MNNKVKFLRGTATEYEASTKDNDTFYYTTDDEKLYLGNKEITGGGVTIDDTLSDTSENPVQNKVINAALNNKANLSDIPTTLPANGGNADTVGNLPASSFLGSNTNFNYHFANGAGSDVISSVKGESHIFAFNFTDTPTAYGFLDVSSFDGTGFSPAFGLVRQVWTDWANPSERFVRIYKATSETDGTWTDWSRCNADTLDGKHASEFALKTDIPTTLPANGGTANTARETVSPSGKALLWEDGEGGNLKLISPDGNHSVEMDLFNNAGFRMYFTDNGELTFPADYNSTTKKFNINGNAATVNGRHSGRISTQDANGNYFSENSTNINDAFIQWDGSTYFKLKTVGGNLTMVDNAATVNGLTVQTAVPANAKFTDTTYGNASASAPGLVSTGAQTFAGNKTFNGQVIPAGASAVGTAQARKIYAGTSDMTAGTTKLETGTIYLVYE